MEGSGSREAQKLADHTEPDPVQEAQKLTKPTDPDPEHWVIQCRLTDTSLYVFS
jgi:hypothetical protein